VLIAGEGIGGFGAEVGLDAVDGEVHLCHLPGIGVGFLPVDGDIADAPAVGFHELLGLDEHAAGTAAGVKDAPLVGGEHLDQHADDRAGSVELATLLAFEGGKLGEEVFIDPTEDILFTGFLGDEVDAGDEIDETAQTGLIRGRDGRNCQEACP